MLDQKQFDHEKVTAEKIVSLSGGPASFDRFGEPNRREPDVIFSSKDTLGIEVTTAYYLGDHGGRLVIGKSLCRRFHSWVAANQRRSSAEGSFMLPGAPS